MILLIDLDGTLTNTAHSDFKPMKDGLIDTDLSKIPIINGAREFINFQKSKGNILIITSDSHPKYVKKIAKEIFNIDCIFLTDKPNIEKTIEQYQQLKSLNSNLPELTEKDHFIVIGDSWLDIEFGRKFSFVTIYTSLYIATETEERDGIGQDWKPLKSGPTFYANSFKQINEIIQNPKSNLLCLEAQFQNSISNQSVKFRTKKYHDRFIIYRALARQNNGECDKFAIADKYFQIGNPNRTQDFLNTLTKGISNYINHINTLKDYNWDIFSFVTDKETTIPQNKMKEIFDLVKTDIQKQQIFTWKTNLTSSIRNCPDYQHRKDFVKENLIVLDNVDLTNKNIIIIDDQFTTGATAFEITDKLIAKGAKNIFFIALFYYITAVFSKVCPKCGKQLIIKIKRTDGSKFYSCLLPKYGGNGCGFIKNI